MPMTTHRGRRSWAVRGLAAATSLLSIMALTGCLQNPNQTGGGGTTEGGEWFADGGTPDGDKIVTILGAFGGDEEKYFNESVAEFEKSSGIDIQYVSD